MDMAGYMGPTTSMTHILQKLAVIFGTVASFDVLMQKIYTVTQCNHKKVRLCHKAGRDPQPIRLQCPRRMMDLEVQQHLKDCLFHGVGKYIRDSIRYLFSTPGTSYLQLMVATHKEESKNEEIQDKVRARVAEATESGEGTTELGQNIAKLMVALTKIGHGNRPASTPSSPRERGCSRGHADRGTPCHPSSHNGCSGLGQTTLDHSTPTGYETGATISRNQGQTSQVINARLEGTTNRRDPNSLQCFICQGWGHMAREYPTPATALNQSRGD